MDITVTDVYTPTLTGSQFVTQEKKSDGGGTYQLLEEFYTKGKINGSSIDYTKYDGNSDGYVDGVWLIYNANKYSEVYGESSKFWAYSYNYVTDEALPSKSKPVFNKYANCSQIFLYEGSNSNGEDAHTIIHETGHMLGLDDY